MCFLYAGGLFAGRLAANSEAWSYMEVFITWRTFPGFFQGFLHLVPHSLTLAFKSPDLLNSPPWHTEFSFAFFLHNIHFLPRSVSSSQSTPLSPGLHLLILLIRQASKQTKKKPATSSSHAKAPLDVSSHFVVAVQFWAAACVQPGKSIAGVFCFVRFPGGCTRSSPRSCCSVVHL